MRLNYERVQRPAGTRSGVSREGRPVREEGKRRHGIFVRAWAARTGKENFQAADLPGSVPSGARAARAQRSSGVVARAGSQPGGNAPLRSLLRERGNLQRGAERTLDENSGA